jgi:hypothetical protein
MAPPSCFILRCYCQVSCQVPYDHVPWTVHKRHSGSTVRRRRPTSSGTHHCPVSVSLAVHGALWPDSCPWIGPQLPRLSPHASLHWCPQGAPLILTSLLGLAPSSPDRPLPLLSRHSSLLARHPSWLLSGLGWLLYQP